MHSRRTLLQGVAVAAAGTALLGACTGGPATPQPQPPADGPVPISALTGKTLRVYRTGDPLTRDFREDRANVEVNTDNRVVRVWIG